MERLPNRYPKISQSHKVPLYKGLSLFYPKFNKNLYYLKNGIFPRKTYHLNKVLTLHIC